MHYLRSMTLALCMLGVAFTPTPSQAQQYPAKTLNWIAAFAAGGGTDRWARIISTAALNVLGQPIHVRNMPGASGGGVWRTCRQAR